MICSECGAEMVRCTDVPYPITLIAKHVRPIQTETHVVIMQWYCRKNSSHTYKKEVPCNWTSSTGQLP